MPHRDYDVYDYYALHLEPSRNPSDVAAYFGFELDGQIGELADHYLFKKLKHDGDIVKTVVQEHKEKRRRDLQYRDDLLDSILLNQKQKVRAPHEKRGPIHPHMNPRRQTDLTVATAEADEADDKEAPPVEKTPGELKGLEIAKTFNILDPIFPEQWHLFNPVQEGHDLNVSGVWAQNITGKGSIVCIIDDGLDMDSIDLKANYYAEGSYDFNDKGPEPRPRLSDDRHGTRCAGEVSAVRNEACGVGVAFDSKIAGIRILSKPISDTDEAVAMNYGFNKTQIYSCSWGPPDNGMEMGAPGILIKRAMVNAVQKGRDGNGSIYVFAAGNGAAADDNCNFDGYTNSIYSVTVGAVDRAGQHPYYSERCSALLVVTYSSGNGDAIHTTDVGENQCYGGHGGTSAAGPLAAGIFALALEARPDLTWRDIQWLSVDTAIPIVQEEDEEGEWQTTAYGKKFSHQFGYGKLDAWQYIEAAKDFKNVKPQAWYFSPWQHVRHTIPQGQQGLVSTFLVTEQMLVDANLERLEHVTVTMNIEHTRRGDISVDLKSPSGIISHLSTARSRDDVARGYDDWTFMSVAHWGESGVGTWTVVVKDNVVNDKNGTFVDWKLNLFGESINMATQGLLPLPGQHDDDDHDREDAKVTTASVDVPSTTVPPTGNPSDHQHRPVNMRPTAGTASDPTTTTSSSVSVAPTSTSTSAAIPKPTSIADENEELEFDDEEPSLPSEHFLPSPFPSFGVSKRTQIWIYGAAGLIVIFCISLAIFFWTARRKRQNALARENYEFEMIDDQDDEGGKGLGKRGKRRAGELYDAFAGESDDEVFSDLDEEDRYKDEKSRLSSDSRRSTESSSMASRR